ncbi:integrin alpha-9-like [Saccostrea echinata]|uniref:integrin alpha-9-like n=1 Tax=Saccostrea echinata TaxID=191078 RepID=UPI002A7F28FC|nr:integrin alpha-9-like [Saccostrea echinata]
MNGIISSHFHNRYSVRSACVWFTVVISLLKRVTCYNIDTEHPLIFHGKPGSYFGVTAEIVVESKKWVLVGATKDNFTDRPEIPYPGNVYACQVDFYSKTTCTVLSKLRTPELHANESQDVFEEKQQLLGASILVPEDTTKAIKICAPKWKKIHYFIHQISGNCFLLKNRSDLMNYPELSEIRRRLYSGDYGAPLTGFSLADIQSPVFETLYGSPNLGERATGGIVGRLDGTLSRVKTFKLEVEKSEDLQDTYLTGSLFGYSIATGNLGDNSPHFVVGAPGFGNKNGNIGAFSIFKIGERPIQVKQVEGIQAGGGFGQTLCIADVNGDNNDEILVAAPNWFSVHDQGEQVINDIGAVYIYYGTGTAFVIDNKPQELHGSFSPFSRFGTAIANVGDINRDGYNDIAIGAPFENKEGAVYIFNGGNTQLEGLYSQKILGSNIKPVLQGFGWYISRTAKDLDDNMFNDFAVGAYRSDTAIILRSRNIIDVNCEITTNPDRIPLNASGTSCSYGRDYNPCFSVSLCFNFTGEGIVDTEIDFTITIDANETRKRAVINRNGTQWGERVSNFIVFSNKPHCYNLELWVPVIDRRFFQVMEKPIVLKADYEISNSTKPGKVRAILKRDVTPTFYGKAHFDTGCESEDGTCQPNLSLHVTLDKKRLLIGNDTILQMKILLKNSGEPSFKTSLTINYPALVIFNTIKISQASVKMYCMEMKNNNSIECEIENPFYQRMKGELDVYFEISKYLLELASGYITTQSLVFNATARTDNVYPGDNTVFRAVAVASFAGINLHMSALEEEITPVNNDIQFSNTYRLLNEGPCVIEKVDLQFFIPVRTKDKIFIKEGDVRVQSNHENVHCKASYYPRVNFNTTNQYPLSGNGSSVFLYNNSDIKFIPKDVQPIMGLLESAQYIFCDNIVGPYMCAVVDCTLNMVKPEDSDSRTFSLPFNILLNDLPDLEKGKSFYTFVTRGRVIQNKRLSVPLVLSNNVSEEIYVAIIPQNSFSLDVENVDLIVIILGSSGSLILIMLLVAILWKCGFFKREKRKQIEEFKRRRRKSQMKSMRCQKAVPEL